MPDVIARHDEIVARNVDAAGGVLMKSRGEGDSAFAVFADAIDAARCAAALQSALADEDWKGGMGLRVRMALNTGAAEPRDGDYFGSTVNRCARLRMIARGGQTLLSEATAGAVREQLPPGTILIDLGVHRLKDLTQTEHIFQLSRTGDSEFPPITASRPPNNLPVQLTSFIGRTSEIGAVTQILESARLVTITGTGGAGKTRLSLQVAGEILDRFPDGVWLVELASLFEPALVANQLASTLGIREETGRSLVETAIAALRTKQTLIILDNCEQLVDACAALAERLLRSCAGLRILATSREALGVPGEAAWRIPSLAAPDPAQLPPLEMLRRVETVRLFLDRAALARSGFALTSANAQAIAQICRRLDGIPLAIELAAARVRSLDPQQISERLDDRFSLLTEGARTTVARHRTLRAAIDWSYDLLPESERLLLCRLSVFAGGFSLDAAEEACGSTDEGRAEALGLLTRLVDKSLIIADDVGGETRYRMLDSVRRYAEEHLRDAGEEEATRRRHLMRFIQLAERAEPELIGPHQASWLDRLDMEHDNFRVALEWTGPRNTDAEAVARLAATLWRFWMMRGHIGEARRWLDRAIEGARGRAAPEIVARAENGAGAIAYMQGDYGAARSLFEESLAVRREVGDPWEIAGSLNSLGNLAYALGDYSGARSLYEQAFEIVRGLDDKLALAASLNNLGGVATSQGDFTVARTWLEESLAIEEELGNRAGVAEGLYLLANLALARGDELGARGLYKQSLAIAQEIDDRTFVADSLTGLASVAGALGRPEVAALIFGAAEAVRESLGITLPPSERTMHERKVATARAGLDGDRFRAAWERGRQLPLEAAVDYAFTQTGS